LEPTSPEAQAELTRRHKSAATTVIGLLVASILLSLVALLADPYLIDKPDGNLNMAVSIVILILGLGAVVWRRNSSGERRRQEGKEHMVCLVVWASPLLTRLLSFSFFSFPFFFIYCSKLLFSFFN